jgi:hypothetical protein
MTAIRFSGQGINWRRTEHKTQGGMDSAQMRMVFNPSFDEWIAEHDRSRRESRVISPALLIRYAWFVF